MLEIIVLGSTFWGKKPIPEMPFQFCSFRRPEGRRQKIRRPSGQRILSFLFSFRVFKRGFQMRHARRRNLQHVEPHGRFAQAVLLQIAQGRAADTALLGLRHALARRAVRRAVILRRSPCRSPARRRAICPRSRDSSGRPGPARAPARCRATARAGASLSSGAAPDPPPGTSAPRGG